MRQQRNVRKHPPCARRYPTTLPKQASINDQLENRKGNASTMGTISITGIRTQQERIFTRRHYGTAKKPESARYPRCSVVNGLPGGKGYSTRCSCSSSFFLRSMPHRYPEISPSLRTTRWHGTAIATGLLAQARATARTALSSPMA